MSIRATAEASIDAPIDLVWSVMLDVAAYPAWNPFVVAIHGIVGAPAVGQVMQLEVRWGDGGQVRTTEAISRLEAPAPTGDAQRALLAYDYRGPIAALNLVRGTRLQHLEQRPGGPTVYRTEEDFRGLLARFVPLLRVRDGFARHASALKTRAESLARR